MKKPLFLFVGMSASGKTTIANMLSEVGYSQVWSYTTRPRRYDAEIGHVFISKEEFDNLTDVVAYTKFNGYEYCTTLKQLENADIYVVDPDGIKVLLDNYDKLNRKIFIFYFDADTYNRIRRMKIRGDSNDKIVDRLLNDEQHNWGSELSTIIIDFYNKNGFIPADTCFINANNALKDVYSEVRYTIKELVGGF